MAREFPDEDRTIVRDSGELYGRDYYLRHLPEDYGFPSLEERTRTDLPERAVHWLRTLLKYKLPPAQVLDLGSGHGAFVALLQWAGYHAMGLELSPWLVNYARETFGIPMLLGSIEAQSLDPASIDTIALMDVLEHLQEPVRTMQAVTDALRPDGVLLIQTPKYPEDRSYGSLLEDDDRFLGQLKEREHLYLFSERAIAEFLERLGFGTVVAEQAVFSHYDMFVMATRIPLAKIEPAAAVERLSSSPEGRMVQAVLDLDEKARLAIEKHAEAEKDRAARLQIIEDQGTELGALASALNTREHELDSWRDHFAAAEEDRAARLAVIEEQGRRLGELQAVVSGFTASRAYRILRTFGRWSWADDVLDRLGIEHELIPGPSPTDQDGSQSGSMGVSLDEYSSSIREFNASQPNKELLDAIQSYNHSVLNRFNEIRSLRGSLLLDVGASPHGYAMEHALALGVGGYMGIGLDVAKATYIYSSNGRFGQLHNMDATDMKFPSGTFDAVISLSTFEHVLDIAGALDEISRVMKAGALCLIEFEPIWSSSSGHHLHHFGNCSTFVPPWAHLVWRPEQMRESLTELWPQDAPISLDDAINWVFDSPVLNRLGFREYVRLFNESPLGVKWIQEIPDEVDDPNALELALTSTGLSRSELLVRGFAALLEKPYP